MRVAIGQLSCVLGDRPANELRLRDALGAAEAAEADLLVVPELQLSGYALGRAASDASCTAGDVARVVGDSPVAAAVGFHERADGRSCNSAAYVENGAVTHVHRKLYLCDYPPFDEHRLFEPGDSLRAFDTALGRVAILLCNDAWQPFVPSLAAHDGAELLIVPAASSTVFADAEEYWRDLTRLYARLLECYVVFANRAGEEPGLMFWGGSHIVDPFGEVIAEAPADDEAILFADLDLAAVARRRRELPLLRDLRPQFLRAELERLVRS